MWFRDGDLVFILYFRDFREPKKENWLLGF